MANVGAGGAPRYDSPYDLPPDDVDPNALPTQTVNPGARMLIATNDPAGVTQSTPQPYVADQVDPFTASAGQGGAPAVSSGAPVAPPPFDSGQQQLAPIEGQMSPATAPTPTTRARGGGGAARPAKPDEPLQSAEEVNALAQRRGAIGREEAAVARQTGVEEDKARVEKAAAEREQKAVAEANAEAERRTAEAKSYLASERQKIRDFTPQDIWQGREGARVMSWVLAGIGQFAAGLSGGPNTALQVLNGAVAQWQHKEQQRYERLVADGKMAAEDLADVRLEMANKKAGILEMLSNQRKAELARTLGPEAAAKGDFLTAQLDRQASNEDLQTAEQVQQRINQRKQIDIQERTARAHMLEAGASAARSRAEVDKLRAETAVIQQNGAMGMGGKGMGRAAGKMIDLALLSNQQRDDVESLAKTFSSDPGALKRLSTALDQVQKNERSGHAAEKASENPLGAAVVNSLQGTSLAPRTAYQGVPARERQILRAADLLATKAAEALAHTEKERAEVKAQLMPRPGDPPEVVQEKLGNLLSQTGATTALAGQFANVARTGAESMRGAVPGAETSAPARPSAQQVAEANEWLRLNPRDPRAPAVRARLAEMTGGR